MYKDEALFLLFERVELRRASLDGAKLLYQRLTCSASHSLALRRTRPVAAVSGIIRGILGVPGALSLGVRFTI